MNDPKRNEVDALTPFRAEFERCLEAWASRLTTLGGRRLGNGDYHGLITDPYFIALTPTEPSEEIYVPVWRAAKALQIAETLGPDAALLWKLAN